ncbi:MAG: hypothetical protein SGI91_00665 [Alphaproteobacteria bacterium]|jgi:hypothetical protein|nr:hypothetical protein [Alphaproteobacteria bacterium]
MQGLGKFLARAYVALALAPLVFFALWSVAAFVLGPQIFYGGNWWERDAVLSPERAEELAKDGLVQQVVTFRDGPTGLRKDPATDEFDLYAIGVSQTTLDEVRPSGMFNLTSPARPAPSILKYASSQPSVGQFNNLLIFEPKSGVTTKVFSTRLAISIFRYLAGPQFENVVVFASEKDTDKDGLLSNGDMQDAYVYAVKERTLHKVSGLSGNPVDLFIVANQDYAVIRAVQDDNGDGRTNELPYEDKAPEQSLLFRLDLRTYQAQPLIAAETMKSLQQTLDATAPPKP